MTNSVTKSFEQLAGKILAVEGNIGVGKSTLCKRLTEYLNSSGIKAVYYEEPVDTDMLVLYVSDMKKYAYDFQIKMLEYRIDIHLDAQKKREEGYTVIIDRSLIGDYVFAEMQKDNGNISAEQWTTYQDKLTSVNLQTLDYCVYLDCTSKVALERICKRDRCNEAAGYTIDYLESVATYYKKRLTSKNIQPNSYKFNTLDWSNDSPLSDGDILNFILTVS